MNRTRPLTGFACMLAFVALCVTGCDWNFGNRRATSEGSSAFALLVSPASATIDPGGMVGFTAQFAPSKPLGGSLIWSVTPANGGTITDSGIFTAGGTPGDYSVTATWVSSNVAAGVSVSGSAQVRVLPPPQPDSVLNPDFIQGSGATQSNGSVQNSAIAGQMIPSVLSTTTGIDRNESGFAFPVICNPSGTTCNK